MTRFEARAAFLLVAACLAAGSARADTLYDNIGASQDGSDPLATSAFGPLADSFSTGASSTSLTEVDVFLTLAGNSPTGTVTASLLADDGTSPGAFIATLGTVADSAIPAASPVDFVLGSPIAVSASTRYWVELSSTDSSASWYWSLDTSGPGVASEYYANLNGVFPDAGGSPYLMVVNPGAVPEPSSIALVALGGGAGVAYRRRRR